MTHRHLFFLVLLWLLAAIKKTATIIFCTKTRPLRLHAFFPYLAILRKLTLYSLSYSLWPIGTRFLIFFFPRETVIFSSPFCISPWVPLLRTSSVVLAGNCTRFYSSVNGTRISYLFLAIFGTRKNSGGVLG